MEENGVIELSPATQRRIKAIVEEAEQAVTLQVNELLNIILSQYERKGTWDLSEDGTKLIRKPEPEKPVEKEVLAEAPETVNP